MVCALLYSNSTQCPFGHTIRHTCAPDTRMKERFPLGLYVETRNAVEIFYQWVLRDSLIYGECEQGQARTIKSSIFSRRATFFNTGHQKDSETVQRAVLPTKGRKASPTRRRISVCALTSAGLYLCKHLSQGMLWGAIISATLSWTTYRSSQRFLPTMDGWGKLLA